MKTPSIYAVDDEPQLTELYTIILQAAGYVVKTFNDRAQALGALEGDQSKPDLIITDCLSHSIAVDQFMNRCLKFQPALRFLMASGAVRRSAVPDPARIIQKPFTPEQFLREVKFVLNT